MTGFDPGEVDEGPPHITRAELLALQAARQTTTPEETK